jgi:hypothetical protein
VMAKLEAGGGLLGTTRINLKDKKASVLKLDPKDITSGNDILQRLAQDGVYIDDPEVYSKFNDVNI